MDDEKEKQRLLRIADRWLNPKYAAVNPPRLRKKDALALYEWGFRINSEKSGYEPRFWWLETASSILSDEYDRKAYAHNLERLKQLQGE